MAHRMTAMKFLFPLVAVFAVAVAPPGAAQRRGGDQDLAFQARQSGALMPLRDIESVVVPDMKRRGANYIGAEFNGESGRYRLKFVRAGSVIWVDVDGRTGAILGRAGD
jgi:hypothetical protein